MASTRTYTTVPYSTVFDSLGGSFKQPRQKIFGVFYRPNLSSSNAFWDLVLITNSMKDVRACVDNYLKYPPTGLNSLPGINNVIAVEILPIDDVVVNA